MQVQYQNNVLRPIMVMKKIFVFSLGNKANAYSEKLRWCSSSSCTRLASNSNQGSPNMQILLTFTLFLSSQVHGVCYPLQFEFIEDTPKAPWRLKSQQDLNKLVRSAPWSIWRRLDCQRGQGITPLRTREKLLWCEYISICYCWPNCGKGWAIGCGSKCTNIP